VKSKEKPLHKDEAAPLAASFVLCNVGSWPRLCEKPKTLDCDGINYSFKTTLGIHTASRFNFEVELENIILGAF
jgi:hypothetical protein